MSWPPMSPAAAMPRPQPCSRAFHVTLSLPRHCIGSVSTMRIDLPLTTTLLPNYNVSLQALSWSALPLLSSRAVSPVRFLRRLRRCEELRDHLPLRCHDDPILSQDAHTRSRVVDGFYRIFHLHKESYKNWNPLVHSRNDCILVKAAPLPTVLPI